MNNSPRTHNLPAFLMGLLLMFLVLPNAALAMGQMSIWDSMRANAQETSGDQLDLLPETSVTCEGFGHYINSTNLEEKIEELKDCNIFTGKITIKGTNLTDLTDFSSLQEIQNGLYIENNPSLTSLNGLENLHSVGNTGCCMDGIHIKNNSSLTDIQALSGLRRIKSHLIIWDNPGITTLAALSGMTELWGISVSNTGITNLDGLQNIEVDERNFRLNIGRNQQLTSLDGFAPIENLNDLHIHDNSVLTDLSALNATTSATSIYIKNNESLEYLPAWENLSRVGFITIKDNPELKSLEGLEHITDLWGDIDAINRNAKGHSIKIINNDSLTSLEPLSNLNLIAFNASDLELDGLDTESLDNAHTLRIEDNDSLARCEIEAFIRGAYSYSEEWNPMTFHNEYSTLTFGEGICERVCEGDYLFSPASIQDGSNNVLACGIIQGDLVIKQHNAIDLQALNGISEIDGNLIITDSRLENLDGLENLVSITGKLVLESLPHLTDFGGLDSLEFLGKIGIGNTMVQITNLNWLSHVTLGQYFSYSWMRSYEYGPTGSNAPTPPLASTGIETDSIHYCEWVNFLENTPGAHTLPSDVQRERFGCTSPEGEAPVISGVNIYTDHPESDSIASPGTTILTVEFDSNEPLHQAYPQIALDRPSARTGYRPYTSEWCTHVGLHYTCQFLIGTRFADDWGRYRQLQVSIRTADVNGNRAWNHESEQLIDMHWD